MVSTLSMGFVITGALISVGYTGDATFSQAQVVKFVAEAWSAFLYSLLSLGLCFVISAIGTQIHSLPGCATTATRFFVFASPLIMIAELCCPFMSGINTLDFMEKYIDLVFISPSAQLCPGNPATENATDVAAFKHMTQNRFCAIVAAEFYDAAASDDMCGPPQHNPPRAFNASDLKSWVCSQLDYSSIERTRLWFGWSLDLVFEEQAAYTANEQAIVENNAKMISDVICLADIAEALAGGECTGSSNTKPSPSCSTALLASHSADMCAGGKGDDLMKCWRACSWAQKWYFGGTLVDEYVSITEAYAPIYASFSHLKACFILAMVLRVSFTIFSICYLCWAYSFPDPADPNDPDSEYNVYDGYAEEDEGPFTVLE